MVIEADVLIVGGGFAGLSCFRKIDRRKRRVNLLTDRNHFLFTPLLPLAAVGSVEVRSIVESVHLFEKTPGEVGIGQSIYAIGDGAAYQDPRGGILPPTAQVAMKQGLYLGKALSGKKKRPFTFRSMGMLASWEAALLLRF